MEFECYTSIQESDLPNNSLHLIQKKADFDPLNSSDISFNTKVIEKESECEKKSPFNDDIMLVNCEKQDFSESSDILTKKNLEPEKNSDFEKKLAFNEAFLAGNCERHDFIESFDSNLIAKNIVSVEFEKQVKFDSIESSASLDLKHFEPKIEAFELEKRKSSSGSEKISPFDEAFLADSSEKERSSKFDSIESFADLNTKLFEPKIETLELEKGKRSSGSEKISPFSEDFVSGSGEKPGHFDLIEVSGGGLITKCFESKIEYAEIEKGKSSSDCEQLSPLLEFFARSITDLPPALISEILNCLDPKELGVVSCVSNGLYRIASEHHVWKEFYCERWGQPVVLAPLGVEYSNEKSWKELFVEREYRSKTFLGRFSIDVLYGHKEAVRTVFVLASKKLILTSGYDSVVRMWDMENGVAISSSRPLGCTIRAVCADTKMLIAGGTEGFIQGWRAEEGLPSLFDLKGAPNQATEFRLWEHAGAITCLALDLTRIYSGSWDMTVRVWDRSCLKCVNVLKHSDWVWSLAPHDTTLASVAGPDLYVWDSRTGSRVTVLGDAHVGNTYALARSHTGKLIYTGGEDGSIRMYEFGGTHLRHAATWVPHSGPVYSLSFEFPWLVSASADGRLSLIDVRKLLKTSRSSAMGNAKRVNGQNSIEPPQRMLHGFANNLFSVDIGCDRIVCGGEEGVVRIWNFSQALEIEHKVRALRGMRLENRMRRRKHQNQMNGKGLCTDQCSVAAKKNPKNGDRGRLWIAKRGVGGKAKA